MSSLDTWPWCVSQSQYTDGFAVRSGTTCVSSVGTQIWQCCAAFLQIKPCCLPGRLPRRAIRIAYLTLDGQSAFASSRWASVWSSASKRPPRRRRAMARASAWLQVPMRSCLPHP